MNYNEDTAALRRIPIYLVDVLGAPVPGLTLTGSEVQVSKSGDAFVNGGGSVTEVGSGYYYYEATQAETATDSFIVLKIVDGSLTARPYVYFVDIGDRIEVGEATASARRLPIYLVDSSGDPVTGLTLSGSEVQLSILGAAFANGTGTVTPTGSGVYYYELAEAEVADVGTHVLKVVDVAAMPYIFSYEVFEPSAEATDCGGYFGAYFGMCDGDAEVDEDDTPVSVPAPIVSDDQTTHDHVARVIDRLPQFAKTKSQ